MEKKRYYQRSTMCTQCHFYWKAGIRNTSIGDEFFPDGCTCSGYSFNDNYGTYEGCEMYMSEEQYIQKQQQKELMKKHSKRMLARKK